jgi:DNA-binding SARP family transcriptional activator
MAIEFRVLGPLEVRRDSALVKISSPKQRLLLALLLSQANEVVTVDALIDGLWNRRLRGRRWAWSTPM